VSVMLPLAMQSVGAAAPDEAAVRMLPLTLSVPLGALVGGRLMLRWPDYRSIAIIGCTLAAAALGGIALVPIASVWGLGALMLPLGIGIGLTLPAMFVAPQMAVGPQQIGVVTATTAFFRSLGGAIGIALLTSLLFTAIGAPGAGAAAGAGQDHLRAGDGAAQAATGPAALAVLAGSALQRLEGAFALAFAAAGVASLLAALAAFGLPRRASAPPPVNSPLG
jgi:hypothetical protein